MLIVVLAGTNGEAVALTAAEKSKLVSTTRELAIQLGRPDMPVILGCGGGSTRAVIEETRLGKAAGADYALVMVPSYFHFAMNEDAIVSFFREVYNIHQPFPYSLAVLTLAVACRCQSDPGSHLQFPRRFSRPRCQLGDA